MEKISKYPKAFEGRLVGDELPDFEKNSSSMSDDRLAMNDMTIPQNPATMMDTEPMPEEPIGLAKYPGQTPTTVVPEMLRPIPEQTAQMQPEPSQPVMPTTDPQAAMFDQMKSGVSTGLNMAKKAGQELRNELAQNQMEQKRIVDDFQLAKKDFDKTTDDNAKIKIDQGRFWGSMDTGNKLLAAVSVALGGIGSGLTGKPNMALDIINKKIDQDIEIQKKDKDSLYNANLQKFKSAEMAYNATKAAALGQVQNIQNNYTSKINDANMQQDMAKFNAQLGLMKSQLAQKTESDIQNNVLMNAAVAGKLSPQQAQLLPEKERDRYFPDIGLALSKPTPEQRKSIATTGSIIGGLEELKKRAKDIGTTIPGSIEDQENKNKIASIQLQMKDAYQLGALSGSDYDMLNRLVADPGAMRTESAVKQIDSSINSMRKIQDGVYNSLGLKPAPRPMLVSTGKIKVNK